MAAGGDEPDAGALTPAFDALEAAVKEIRAALDAAKNAPLRGDYAAREASNLEAARKWSSSTQMTPAELRTAEVMTAARDAAALEIGRTTMRSMLAGAAADMHKARANMGVLATLASIEIGGRAGFILNGLREGNAEKMGAS